jgi:CRP-like cAMP-binding protein
LNSVFKQKLYLIVSGTVAVYTEDGVEVAHLCDANMFGEIAFLLHDEDNVRVIAACVRLF